MKEHYEDRTRYFLPRRTYTILRLDGVAWHTYTRKLEKPFDPYLIHDLDEAVLAVMPKIQGAKFAYIQSDEVSILLTDFGEKGTSAWFDGNLQKITSVAASMLTAEFNRLRLGNLLIGAVNIRKDFHPASFDCRAFTIPDPTEVMNYFIWRNQDAMRNSVNMVAQSLFSHRELHKKTCSEMQEMIFQKEGINWADYNEGQKNGRLAIKETYSKPLLANVSGAKVHFGVNVNRTRWVIKPAWKFTSDKPRLRSMIPDYADAILAPDNKKSFIAGEILPPTPEEIAAAKEPQPGEKPGRPYAPKQPS